MTTPLPLSPFLDPVQCDLATLAAHMLSELNYTVGIVAREARAAHASVDDMRIILDTILPLPLSFTHPSPEFLDACAR
jgi:hypothetical protein